jgi:hypothetical protein
MNTLIKRVIPLVMLSCLTSINTYAETTQTTESIITTAAMNKADDIVEVIDNEHVASNTGINEITPVVITDESFSCIRDMTPVRHFYVDNLIGNLEGTLAAANNPEGAIYPAGSVVQLVPTEVMVKREAGTFPPTGDWEFFELNVDDKSSTIGKRGFVDVVNRFGGNCFGCHVPAKEPWDFICETDRGCDPIPLDHKMTGAIQRSDPRCGEPELESGDSMALFKLKAMMTIGKTKQWFEDTF